MLDNESTFKSDCEFIRLCKLPPFLPDEKEKKLGGRFTLVPNDILEIIFSYLNTLDIPILMQVDTVFYSVLNPLLNRQYLFACHYKDFNINQELLDRLYERFKTFLDWYKSTGDKQINKIRGVIICCNKWSEDMISMISKSDLNYASLMDADFDQLLNPLSSCERLIGLDIPCCNWKSTSASNYVFFNRSQEKKLKHGCESSLPFRLSLALEGCPRVLMTHQMAERVSIHVSLNCSDSSNLQNNIPISKNVINKLVLNTEISNCQFYGKVTVEQCDNLTDL
jgi:hypothetical protein